mmetsp:Transcript_68501/g.137752  ORF Transcript_68501/g.137752 Transcript_68501/m.137752 type:complete len:101 (+) Transcript_68501:1536-1838(+)
MDSSDLVCDRSKGGKIHYLVSRIHLHFIANLAFTFCLFLLVSRYKSMAAVVVLPLHKSIGEEGRTYPQTNQTFNTILGMVVPREVHVTNSRLASRLDRTL